MSKTKKKTKKKKVTKHAGAAKRIRVRMYNVGFGDCFLLWLPTKAGERRMLVDCGYHSLGKGKFTDKELVAQVTKDLDGAHLDVVVATHRHQDHISGFGETELWEKIAVEEVWLPFTASDEDGEAHEFAAWEHLLETASDLVDAAGRLSPAAADALGARPEEEMDAVRFMLWNARKNAPGIENLKNGMRRQDGGRAFRRYLPSDGKDVPFRLESPVLPGVVVHVLGPARDSAFRKKRKAPAEWGVAEAGLGGSNRGSPLFGSEWRIPSERLPGRRPFKPESLTTIGRFNDDLLDAAAAVDGYLNGESLVLVLELGHARLLLTGDAEVGAWLKILGDPAATALAAGATFLKCGHHGSHNATPLLFLEEHLSQRTPVMMSTQEGDGSYRNHIPRREILDVLAKRKMPLARSDTFKKSGTPFTRGPDGLWVDCELPV